MKRWLSDFPTSQALSLGALLLTATVLLNWCVAAVWYAHPAPDGLETVLVFLGAWLGIDTTRFVFKRKTEVFTPPQVMAQDAALPAAAAAAAVAAETAASAPPATRAAERPGPYTAPARGSEGGLTDAELEALSRAGG